MIWNSWHYTNFCTNPPTATVTITAHIVLPDSLQLRFILLSILSMSMKDAEAEQGSGETEHHLDHTMSLTQKHGSQGILRKGGVFELHVGE